MSVMKVVVSGDLKVSTNRISGTRVFVQRFWKALRTVAEREGFEVCFAGGETARKLRRAVDLLRLSKHATIIHCLTAGKDTLLALFCAKLYQKKLVMTVHGHWSQSDDFWYKFRFRRNHLYYDSVIRKAHAVIFPSEELKRSVERVLGTHNRNAFVIPNGIERDLIINQPRKYPVSKQIGIFARPTIEKGIKRLPTILEAANKLKLMVRWVGADQLPILGSNTYSFIAEPPVPPEKVPFIMDECLVVAVPSLFESFSQVALEAMARGVPVITSEKVGIASLIRQYSSGIIVNFENENDLVEAIEDILEDYEGYSKRALLCARDHVWDRIIGNYMKIYKSLL